MVRPKPDGPEGQRQAWGQGSEPGYISHRARERGCCRWRGCENTALGWGSGQSLRLLSTPGPGWVPEKTNPWRKAPWRSLRPLHRPVASLGRGGGVAAMEGSTPIAPLPPPPASDLRVRRTPGVCFPVLPTKLNNLAWTSSGARPHFPSLSPKDARPAPGSEVPDSRILTRLSHSFSPKHPEPCPPFVTPVLLTLKWGAKRETNASSLDTARRGVPPSPV